MRSPGRHAEVLERLAAAGCVAAEEEARELIAAASDDVTLEQSIRRREQGEPLAWIVGTVEFCGRRIGVDRGVYVPRRQSEELAGRAVDVLRAGGRTAVDLCTGAGAIAAHLVAEVPGATVLATDIDQEAVRCARRNGVHALVADLGEPLRAAAFDVVTAVAPYVPTAEVPLLSRDVQSFEPRLALDGGPDGLDIVRRVVDASARLLRPGGWLLIEVGAGQDRELRPALDAVGLSAPGPWFDEDGDLRGLAARRTG